MFWLSLDTQPKRHEIYFTATRLINLDGIGCFIFIFRQDTSVVWIDNSELKNIQVTPVKLDGFFHTKLNPSEITHSFSLDGYNCVTPTNKSCKAEQKATLAPYTSISYFDEAGLCRLG